MQNNYIMPKVKNSFIRELSDVVSQQEFSVISTTVKKDILKNSYRYDNNPYHIALKFCVEHLFNFLIASNQQKKITHIVVEQHYLYFKYNFLPIT
jgi:hypothetical protein